MPRPATLLVLVLSSACGAPGAAPGLPRAEASAGPPAPAVLREPATPTPWTDAFLVPAVLMADTIRVEGPPGLFEHAVSRGDDALYQREVRTTPEGMVQIVRTRPTAPDLDLVRAQLDAWQLAAFRELVFLERFEQDAPVLVIAAGEAEWRDTNGQERREPRLVFRGTLPAGE